MAWCQSNQNPNYLMVTKATILSYSDMICCCFDNDLFRYLFWGSWPLVILQAGSYQSFDRFSLWIFRGLLNPINNILSSISTTFQGTLNNTKSSNKKTSLQIPPESRESKSETFSVVILFHNENYLLEALLAFSSLYHKVQHRSLLRN